MILELKETTIFSKKKKKNPKNSQIHNNFLLTYIQSGSVITKLYVINLVQGLNTSNF